MTTLRLQIDATLRIFGKIASDASLDMWELALAPEAEQAAAALTLWLRVNNTAPVPSDILELIHVSGHLLAMQRILTEVTMRTGIPYADMHSQTKTAVVSEARQQAMYLMHEAGKSYAQIGRFFGRDHTTVAHGVKAHERRLSAQEAAE